MEGDTYEIEYLVDISIDLRTGEEKVESEGVDQQAVDEMVQNLRESVGY